MEFSNWLGGLLRPLKNSGSKLTTRRNPTKRKLHCESLETRRMLSAVALVAHGNTDSTVPQTVVDDVLIAGSPFEGQELAASNNLVDADGLGTIAAAASSSPDYSPDYTTINGRNFGYYVPESYDPSTPTPLLFMFHGMGGNSSEQSGGSAENGYYGWQTTAYENEFIVLFPESLGFFKTWDLGAGGTSSDLSFVDDMIDWADTNYNINTSQIFTTGHSWGAYFSYYVARYRSDDIAAFAAHSGGLGGAFFLGSTPPVPTGPSPTPTLNGIVLHAVDDGIVPYSNSQNLYDDLLANGHNVYDDGIGDDGIIEVDGWGPDNHRYRLQHNQTQWDFFLEVSDDDVPLVLNLAIADASIAEGAGAAATTATVTRSDPRGNLTVTLTSDDTSEATVPAEVTFLDGQSSVTFDIAAVDDSLVDGTQNVTITASAAGYTGASSVLAVTDENVTMIAVMDNGDSGFSQRGFRYQSNNQVAAARGQDNHNMRGGDGWARWAFSDLEDGEYQVSATWAHKYGNKYNAIDAPFSIEDASGTVLATTTVNQMNAPDEFVDDGSSWDSLATLNVTGGSLFVTLEGGSNSNRYTVADAIRIKKLGDIAPTLSLSIADATISESAGTAATTATVTRTHTEGDLVVSLASDDLTEANVPSTVTIADGQSSATFEIAAVDDNFADGTQTVTIAATAGGYAAGSDTLEVNDDEASLVAVIDNQDTGFSQYGFRYNDNQQVASAYSGDNHSMRGGDGTASWNFSGLDDGFYQVAATWAHKYGNKYNAVDAAFSMEDGSGSVLATGTLNQRNAPSEFEYEGSNWDTLATVQVTDGNLSVLLGSGSNPNQYTVADAIRVERVSTLNGVSELELIDSVFGEL